MAPDTIPPIEAPAFLDAFPLGLLIADGSSCLRYVNRRAKALLGFPDGWAPGIRVSSFWLELDTLIRRCLESGEDIPGRPIPYGETRLVCHIGPIRGSKEISGAVCSLQQVENCILNRNAIDAFEFVNRQLNAILNSSSDGLWILDGKGEVLYVNKESEKLSGIKAEEVMAKTISQLLAEGLFDRAVTTEVLKTRRRATMLAQGKRTKRNLLLTGTPTFDENGEIALVVVNERDISLLNSLKRQLEESRSEAEKIKDELVGLSLQEQEHEEIVAESKAMDQVMTAAFKLARFDLANILILGESGTGKGILAKWIHKNGKKDRKAIVQINCAALPESLLEAELFGYEKGAFTGANVKGKPGLFELAQNGTLFLDEIGDLPFSVQAKLLKYLDDREVMRLGGVKPRKIDCTIIAATNRDLEGIVHEKRFREDLFYRLNTFNIFVPPLRERSEDIFPLSVLFMKRYNERYGLNRKIGVMGLDALQAYSFPGNIRELKSIIKMAVILSETDLVDDMILKTVSKRAEKRAGIMTSGTGKNLDDQILAVERDLLSAAMKHSHSTRGLSAYLGISQSKVIRRMRKHRLTFR
jgi:PAS domain S-box-containing protein